MNQTEAIFENALAKGFFFFSRNKTRFSTRADLRIKTTYLLYSFSGICKYGLGGGEVSVFSEPLENQIRSLVLLVVSFPSCSLTARQIGGQPEPDTSLCDMDKYCLVERINNYHVPCLFYFVFVNCFSPSLSNKRLCEKGTRLKCFRSVVALFMD